MPTRVQINCDCRGLEFSRHQSVNGAFITRNVIFTTTAIST